MKFAYRTAIPVLLISALAACDRDNASETAQAPGAPLPLSEPLTTERTVAPAPPTGNAGVATAPQSPAENAAAAVDSQAPAATVSASTSTPQASTVGTQASASTSGTSASAGTGGTTASAGAPAAGSQGPVGTSASPAASGLSGGTSATQHDAAHARVMDKLLGASQQLREALHELAQQPSSAQRDQAMKEARQALYDTQQAMIRLPTTARPQQ